MQVVHLVLMGMFCRALWMTISAALTPGVVLCQLIWKWISKAFTSRVEFSRIVWLELYKFLTMIASIFVRHYSAVREQGTMMSVSVAMSISQEPDIKFHQVSMHAACRHGSVLLWLHCNTLCTLSFVDDVIFPTVGCETGGWVWCLWLTLCKCDCNVWF